jgi:hypothetical protein
VRTSLKIVYFSPIFSIIFAFRSHAGKTQTYSKIKVREKMRNFYGIKNTNKIHKMIVNFSTKLTFQSDFSSNIDDEGLKVNKSK